MKTIVTTLFLALSILFCEAKPSTKTLKTYKISKDKEIPTYVKKWLHTELENTTTALLETFETPAFFTRKNAKIIGYIKGYNQSLGAKTGMFYYTNQLTREQKPRVIEIHKDGRFELELPLAYPTQNYFLIKNQVISFYVEPGQNLSVILNWEDIKQRKRISYPLKNVIYQGALSKINTDLLHYNPSPKSRKFQQKEEVMQPKAYKNFMLKYKTDALNKISAYEQSGVIDKKTKELLDNEILLETYYYLFDYYSPTHSPRYGQGKRKANKIDDTLPEDYYDFIKDLPLHKQSILVSKQFSNLVNRLEFSELLKAKSKPVSNTVISEDFLDFISTNNLKISDKYIALLKQMIKNPKKQNITDIEKLLTLKFYEENKTVINRYFSENSISKQLKKEFIRKRNVEDSLATALNIKNNLVYEIIQCRKLDFILKSKMPEDKTWYWNEVKKQIKSPHLLKVGDDLLKNDLVKPEYYKLPIEETGTTIFNALIAPYKGKVIVVQFWDLWTYYQGKDLESLKEKRNSYAGNKEVVFLNITNKSDSSLEKYNKSVAKNGFKNSIRIPQDDYHYLRQLFQFNTSVHDLIVSKDGVSVYELNGTYEVEYALSNRFKILSVK